MRVVPFSGFASFTEEVVLDNVVYLLTFNWNHRGQYWSMIISDIDNNSLYAGIKVVPAYELIHDFPDRGLPPGGMVAIDPSRLKSIIERDDLGSEMFVIYATEEEYALI